MNPRWLLLPALLATGCMAPYTWTPVPISETTLPGGFAVKAGPLWNQLDGGPKQAHHVLWTVHGAPLDQMHFYTGVADGEPLVPAGKTPSKQLATFKANAQPEDIVELYEARVSQDGSTFTRDKLAPCPFAGGDGFRFEFTLIRKSDEVTCKGVGFAVVKDRRLYLMVFQAARLHYYPTLLGKVEEVARTARISPSA